MSAERNARPRPARRRLRHDGGVADRGELAESGCAVLDIIAHLVEFRIGTGHAADAAEMAEPMTGLRQRAAHMPRAAFLGAARQRRHGGEGEQIAGGVVELLGGKGFWVALAERFGFCPAQAARRLYQRIKTTPLCPRAFVAVGAKRDIDDPRPQTRNILRTKAVP